MVSKHGNQEQCQSNHSRLFTWFRLWPVCGNSIKLINQLIIPLIIRLIIPNYSYQFQLFLWLRCSNRSKRKTGPATVPAPPLRALPTDTTVRPRSRQSLIQTARQRPPWLDPETPRLLLRHSSLPETPGRYGTATVMAAMSYSRLLARHCPPYLQV